MTKHNPVDPTATSTSTATSAEPGNSLLFTNLHWTTFEDAAKCLRDLIEHETSAHVSRFVPLSSFFRCLVVFDSQDAAARVRQLLNGRVFKGGKKMNIVDAGTSDESHLTVPSDAHAMLQVPEIERNFLVSPPGSPPVGWVQNSESQPSTGGHHAAMIIDALSQMDDFSLDADAGMEPESADASRSADYTVEGALSEREVAQRLGIQADDRTRHILTFGSVPPGEAKNGGMEWEVELPAIIVQDHTKNESDDSSHPSLNEGMQAMGMSLSRVDSLDSIGELPGSVIGGSHMPRTSMPPLYDSRPVQQ
ncbi:hypothetical protein HDU81_007353 [Chytriomyces hyalinus]|nr:hypothetical protein HDU81_007353 [Chytriomyces hyalinus]